MPVFALLLCRVVEDVGHRVGCVVAAPCALGRQDSCVVAEADEDLATQGALNIQGEKRDAEGGGVCRAVRTISEFQSKEAPL